MANMSDTSTRERERSDTEDPSLLRFLIVVLRGRRLIMLSTVALTVLMVGVALVLPSTYTVRASFYPQGPTGPSAAGLAAVAGQFGLRLPGEDPTQSPEFYADLIMTRAVLWDVVQDSFELDVPEGEVDGRGRMSLVELVDPWTSDPAERREETLEWLRDAVTSSVDRETGVVRLAVKTEWAPVSLQISQDLLALVNAFNLNSRQDRAEEEREFVEQRVEEARAELVGQEQELRRFLENNREFRSSPSLLLEYERIQRAIALKQQVFTTLSQAFEEARIAEVRNTPVITVVEPPVRPVEPDEKGLVRLGLAGLLMGAAIGTFLVFGREYLERQRSRDPQEYAELRESWRKTPGGRKARVGEDGSGSGQ